MTLARPELLLLVPAAAALVVIAVLVQWRRVRRLERVFSEAALRRLVPAGARRFPLARMLFVVVAALATGVAAVGPEREAVEPPAPPAPLDLAIAVDISLSMAATDAEPSRLERAREVIAGLAEALPNARTSLVVFADWPFTLVPPTEDPDVVRWFAGSLQADLVIERDQGTALSAAITQARETLEMRPRQGARRVVLIVSDGGAHEETDAVIAAARAAAGDGVEVWTAGVGSGRGNELETATGPVLDASGTPVMTRLDQALLVQVANAGGGAYEHVGDDRGVRALVARLQGPSDTAIETRGTPDDAALLLALLALPLLLLEGALDNGRGPRASRRDEEAR